MPSNSKMLMAATRLMDAPAKVASVRSVGIFLRQQQHRCFSGDSTLLYLSSNEQLHNLCSSCQMQT